MRRSKLFDLKDDIMLDGFFNNEEELDVALNAFANESLSSLLQDMYELMDRYQSALQIEDTPSDAPPFGAQQDYAPSGHIWDRMHDLISIMILKNEHGDFF
jgi:hypothetical protein